MTKEFRGHTIHYQERPEFWDNLEGWEPETFDMLDRFLGPGKEFLDIGAWNGVLSVYANLLGATPYAIEPDWAAYGELCQIFYLNGISEYHVFNMAISDKDEAVMLHNEPSAFGNSMSTMLSVAGKISSDEVWATTMESIVDSWDIQPDLIKMDTEGAEVIIIPAAVSILKGLNSPLLLSLHPQWIGQEGVDKVMKSLSEVYDLGKMETMIHDQYLFIP